MSEVSNNVITSKSDPAFPSDPRFPKHMSGMSIRDYFAGQALKGILTRDAIYSDKNMEKIAQESYKAADAMLFERLVEEVK